MATVTLYTDDKAFKMTYDLDDVTKKLDSVASNPILQQILKTFGFQIEVVKKEEAKPSEMP